MSDTPLSDQLMGGPTDRVAELERELAKARQDQMAALGLVARIREALGDNGVRMQDELIAYCKELAACHAIHAGSKKGGA